MKKLYLAGPFFNPEQVKTVDTIKEIFTDHGWEVYSPKDIFIVPPNADEATRQATFRGNIDHMDKADAIIAITDGKDVGTIWEAGYAYGKRKPIIYFCQTLSPDAPFNLMLAQSGISVVRSYKELSDLLFQIHESEAILNQTGHYHGIVQ